MRKSMEYEKMSLVELKETAKKVGIKGVSALRKSEVIAKLQEYDNAKLEIKKETVESKNKEKEKEKVKKTITTISRPSVEEKEVVRKAPIIKETGKKKETISIERYEKGEKIIRGKQQKDQEEEASRNFSEEIMESRQEKTRTMQAIPTSVPVIKEKNNYHIGENERENTIGNATGNTMGQNTNTGMNYHKPQSGIRPEYRNLQNRNQLGNNRVVNTNTINGQQKPYRQPSTYTEPTPQEIANMDSGETKEGILEVMPDGYGFIRCDNFLPGENDVYVSPAQIRRQNLKTGDIIVGNTRIRSQSEKFSALLYIKTVNGFEPSEALKRKRFEDLTPVFPNERIHLETPGAKVGVRMMDLVSPIGKGQRGMIVSPPKAGKTTLLKQVAGAITRNHPEMHLIILLIDERPEEVTDIKESIEGKNVEVIYSTFDELPENHKRVSEMVIERARRLVEHKKDVTILLDSITRLTRAYNLVVPPSGRTLSGGLDPAALHMPKKFFGAARNIREGGSLTILATALVETGSRMDDVVFEEFKGTGNMEIVLDRSLSEKRIFPAIDLHKSSTRRDDLLLNAQEIETNRQMHRVLSGMKSEDALERIIELFMHTRSNKEFMEYMKKTRF